MALLFIQDVCTTTKHIVFYIFSLSFSHLLNEHHKLVQTKSPFTTVLQSDQDFTAAQDTWLQSP